MNQQKAVAEFEVVAAPNQAIAVTPKSPKERAALALRSDERKVELAALAIKSVDIVEVLNVDGRTQVHRMAMDLKNTRCKIENESEDVRSDSTKFSKAVIEVERELVGIIKPEETRMFALRDGFDAKLAAEEAERQRIEEARIAAIQAKIDAILARPAKLVNATSAELTDVLTKLAAYHPSAEEYAELLPVANAALDATAETLILMRNETAAREKAEADRLAEIEATRVKMEAQAEANRVEAARLAAELAEQQRVAAESKRQLEAQAAAIEAARKQAEAAAAAEAQRQADERAAFEAEKAEFARQQAAIAEAARIAAMPPPAPVEVEAVQTAVEAEETAPEPVCAVLAADPVMSAETASLVAYMDDQDIGALREALWSLLETKTADEVRSIVEVELAAFAQSGGA